MQEDEGGERSQIYFSNLPAFHNCLFSWTDKERSELAGGRTTLASSKISLQMGLCSHEGVCRYTGTCVDLQTAAGLPAIYRDTVQPIFKAHPRLWPEPWDTYATFEHAAGLVQSRSFHLEETNWVQGSTEEGVRTKHMRMTTFASVANNSDRPVQYQ